ncbi:MAG: serine/threonine protein kinase, partial [Deltaproteobacteria bacterium]|nr:serine/threonine protein kinase [Deltaproteobacteria bacterium]
MDKAGLQRPDANERLGAYEIIRKLARGGMAELFVARSVGPQSFEKVVALKKILPRYAKSPRFVQLFCDEARLAASLNHMNIVQVYDLGIDDGNYFFAMEYLHGQDLRTILHRSHRNRDKMPIRFAVQIALQIASALHYAHEMRRPDGSLVEIVHRDVSPSNIVVTYDGAVKLLDFGVAKASTRTVKTRTGTLKGKISYMSPEQAKGAIVDRRSDIFALGIVLWEMVTTSRLFRADNDLATLQLIINTPPRLPTQVRPDCPPELERIILKALAQDIQQRYQTADELLRDLEAFANAESIALSSNALSIYVSELFGPEIDSWNVARAAGVPLAEHLTHVGDMTEPISESEFIEAIDVAAMLAQEEAAGESFDEHGDESEGDDPEDREDREDSHEDEHPRHDPDNEAATVMSADLPDGLEAATVASAHLLDALEAATVASANLTDRDNTPSVVSSTGQHGLEVSTVVSGSHQALEAATVTSGSQDALASSDDGLEAATVLSADLPDDDPLPTKPAANPTAAKPLAAKPLAAKPLVTKPLVTKPLAAKP